MSGRKARAAYAAAILSLMLLSSLQSAARPSPIEEPQWGVLDPQLQDLLGHAATDERLDCIVQFRGLVERVDREVLADEGLQLVHEFHIVPAVWVRATVAQLERLAGYARTAWVEHNDRLYYDMNGTTTVINATRSWNAMVQGSLWGQMGIDGKGVTVVVLDSGIDAGHPDFDYGTKTIHNLKSDTGTGPWVEVENGDTSSGHGTHVAGTVAGNGDASAGAYAGVAPGANLIGLSAGELLFITGGLGGLEWVYDHSRPGNNPYNIRVVSNSWGGGGGQYNPQDSISQAINRLVYENNVLVNFAAGNSGGTGDDIQASNYGNTPAAICVAAADHEGTGITDFSSKGQWDWVDTWPDVAAPGLNIISTAARRTLISTMAKNPNANPYYLGISGTSMATPHISGVAALLWQAAPHLRVSEVRQDAGVVTNEGGSYVVGPPAEEGYGSLAYGYQEWTGEALDTRIHEIELILKLTATMLGPEGEPQDTLNGQTANYIPDWNVPGFADGRAHDFSQGYGLVNVYRAVGLALALEKLRTTGHPEATVMDAYRVFEPMFANRTVSWPTDMLSTSWGGEWTRFNEQGGRTVFTTNQTKYVYVPEGASSMSVALSYPSVDLTELTFASLGFLIDWDDDGTWDYTGSMAPSLSGVKVEDVPLSGDLGRYVKFGLQGRGFRVQRVIETKQYQEARVEYTMSVAIGFPSDAGSIVVGAQDLHAIVGHLRLSEPSPSYARGNMSVEYDVYDLDLVQWNPVPPPEEPPVEQGGWLLWAALLIVLLIGGALAMARLRPQGAIGRSTNRMLRAMPVGPAVGVVRRVSASARSVVTRRKRPAS